MPNVVLTNEYDADGNRTQLSATIAGTADFLNTYSYDALNRLTQLYQDGQTGGNAVATKGANLTYNALGQLATITRTNFFGVGRMVKIMCAVKRRRFPAGASPARRWVAPAGSNRSGSGGNETAEASGAKGRFWRLREQAGRNVSERRAGLERPTCGNRSVIISEKVAAVRGRSGKRTRRSHRGIGVGMSVEEIDRNTGSPSGESA